eukprot:scaffold16926_cov59-Attheya_sp.AAC.1
MKIGGSYMMAVAAVALCAVPSFGMRVRLTERGTRVSRQATSSKVKRNLEVGGTDKKRRNLENKSAKSAKAEAQAQAKANIEMFVETAQLASAASTEVMSTPETSLFRDRTSNARVRGAAQKDSSQVDSLSRESRIAADEFLITPQVQCDTFNSFAETWFSYSFNPNLLCEMFEWMNPYVCFIDVDLINNNQTLAEAYCASLFFDSSGNAISLGGDYDNFDCFAFCAEFIGSNPIDPQIFNATDDFTQGHCCTRGYYPRGDNVAA